MSRLPPGLRLHDPSTLLATAGGLGLLPGAPGTWASLAALPPAWLLAASLGHPWLAAAAGAVSLAGLWAAAGYLRASGEADPGPVVIDEVAGQLLALAAVPPDIAWYVAGFALFRVLDIAKPWPVSAAERVFRGAFGVMADDIAAGAIACAALLAARSAL